MQPPLTLEKQVIITIMNLATPNSLQYITNQFGMGKSMAREEVCLVIQNILANCFICLINPQEVVTGFCQKGFPNNMGALDSTHIRTICLPQGPRLFINCKG
ncbi:hypothetical protein Y1Q_0014214 [Alligator mississippiensis]|uniref:DDE Tnp4 domain-containing protein n=1 Tax=Alligator mississippiensis TaxID=8496 RepID=A0A151MU24_ALLMI|nr:hypothetical protein Y1Q_0014214 [Alligator mississippiensis]